MAAAVISTDRILVACESMGYLSSGIIYRLHFELLQTFALYNDLSFDKSDVIA